MQVALVMLRSNGQRRSFPISRDSTTIGRREDCDLRIPLVDVSRKHCRLVIQGSALRLDDLGSSNGTYHNGQRVQGAILKPGDLLQIGPISFIVQVDGEPAEQDITFPDLSANAHDTHTGGTHSPAPSDSAAGTIARPAAPKSARPAKPASDPIPLSDDDSTAGDLPTGELLSADMLAGDSGSPATNGSGDGADFDPLEALQDPASEEDDVLNAEAAAELDFNFVNDDDSSVDQDNGTTPQKH